MSRGVKEALHYPQNDVELMRIRGGMVILSAVGWQPGKRMRHDETGRSAAKTVGIARFEPRAGDFVSSGGVLFLFLRLHRLRHHIPRRDDGGALFQGESRFGDESLPEDL